MRAVSLAVVAVGVVCAACSESADSAPEKGSRIDDPVTGTGGVEAAVGTGGAAPVHIGDFEAPSQGGSDGLTANGVPLGDGTPEICDGLDNDSNGIIDDVDVGHDGVCDCLNIATIGHIGPWSDGGDIFATWLDERSPLGAVALGDQVLTEDLLRPFQVIVVLHVDQTEVTGNSGALTPAHHAFSDAEAAAFQAWLTNGGGVMTTIGYTSNEPQEVLNVNRLLNPVGMGYSTTNVDLTGDITRWEAHPVTGGVSRIFTDNGAEPAGAVATTLAWDASDRVALQVAEVGNGRVVVWGDEWLTYDSEWTDLQDQQVELFWLNLLSWLSPPEECQVPIPPDLVY